MSNGSADDPWWKTAVPISSQQSAFNRRYPSDAVIDLTSDDEQPSPVAAASTSYTGSLSANAGTVHADRNKGKGKVPHENEAFTPLDVGMHTWYVI